MPAGCYRRRSEFAFGAHNRDDAGIAARQSCSTSRREALLEFSRMRETWQKRRNQLRAKPSRHHEHYLHPATHPSAHLKRPEMPATAAHPIRSGTPGKAASSLTSCGLVECRTRRGGHYGKHFEHFRAGMAP